MDLRINFFIIFSFISLSLLNAQNVQFQKTYFIKDYSPGIQNIHTNFYDIEPLNDGGYVTLGFVTDTFNVSEGIITKYDCLGNPVWSKLLGRSGSPTNTNFGSVEADNGDIVFSFNLGTGFFRASILAGRISASGQIIWTKRLGVNTEFGRDIAKTSDGGFIIAGSTAQYGTDPQAADIYLLKLDSTGNVLWTKTFGNPGSSYDEAYSVKVDSKENIIVAGRCIDEQTFKAFILKTDPIGQVLGFKTFGYDNQRTYCFDLAVDQDDHYLITGSTTILEANHQSSEYDVFLIKTDPNLNPVFMNIYEVVVGNDAGSIGEGLAVLPDGSYAIGVSTFAFTTHGATGPNAPNKNALYIIRNTGTISKAYIYNMKGSQYSRVRNSAIGGVILSAFSTAYANNVNFQGLLIKTNSEFESGCFDINVTSELKLQASSWTVRDFQYTSRSGYTVNSYSNIKDTVLNFNSLCETTIELSPFITGPRQACPNHSVEFKDLSTGDPSASHRWIVNGMILQGQGNQNFTFKQPGVYEVIRIMTLGCVSREYRHPITILPYLENQIQDQFCLGESYNFRGKDYTLPGSYSDTIPNSNGTCDSIITLILSTNPFEDLGTIYDSISCGQTKTYWNTTYNTGGLYNTSLKNISGCDSVIAKIQVYASKINNINKTICDGESFIIGDSTFTAPVQTSFQIIQNGCHETIHLNLDVTVADTIRLDTTLNCGKSIMIENTIIDKAQLTSIVIKNNEGCTSKVYIVGVTDPPCDDCIEFPNLFTPQDQDNRNRVFKPIIPPDCKVVFQKLEFNIYNRWGKNVYSTTNIENFGWNGDVDGQPAPMESYIYHLKYELLLQEKNIVLKGIERKGVVSLIR